MSNLFQRLSTGRQIVYDIAVAIQALVLSAKIAQKGVE
jgi:hypothetical protein